MNTENPHEHCESPRFRDFVCSLGCAYAMFGREPDECWGEIEPHHFPLVSRGGDDFDIKAGLCSKHHQAFHHCDPAVSSFIITRGDVLRRWYISKWLNEIERLNGLAPAPKRKQRASTRKNREKYNYYKKPWET